MQPQFLHDLHAQLSATSPLMAIARGGPFAQLVHHKTRCQLLVDDLEDASAAELAAREAAASRVESYAVRAESMHRRLHNRSASQAAEWLRAGVKRASDSGNKVQARHMVENETKRVKTGLEVMSEWLDGDAKKRITSLPTRFDALTRRALMHSIAQQVPQIAGGQRHRRTPTSMLGTGIHHQHRGRFTLEHHRPIRPGRATEAAHPGQDDSEGQSHAQREGQLDIPGLHESTVPRTGIRLW